MTINHTAIHRLAKKSVKAKIHEIAVRIADAQTMTVRCADCKWSMKNIRVGDGKRAYLQHRELRHGGDGV